MAESPTRTSFTSPLPDLKRTELALAEHYRILELECAEKRAQRDAQRARSNALGVELKAANAELALQEQTTSEVFRETMCAKQANEELLREVESESEKGGVVHGAYEKGVVGIIVGETCSNASSEKQRAAPMATRNSCTNAIGIHTVAVKEQLKRAVPDLIRTFGGKRKQPPTTIDRYERGQETTTAPYHTTFGGMRSSPVMKKRKVVVVLPTFRLPVVDSGGKGRSGYSG